MKLKDLFREKKKPNNGEDKPNAFSKPDNISMGQDAYKSGQNLNNANQSEDMGVISEFGKMAIENPENENLLNLAISELEMMISDDNKDYFVRESAISELKKVKTKLEKINLKNKNILNRIDSILKKYDGKL